MERRRRRKKTTEPAPAGTPPPNAPLDGKMSLKQTVTLVHETVMGNPDSYPGYRQCRDPGERKSYRRGLLKVAAQKTRFDASDMLDVWDAELNEKPPPEGAPAPEAKRKRKRRPKRRPRRAARTD